MSVLVLVDHDRGNASPETYEALALARATLEPGEQLEAAEIALLLDTAASLQEIASREIKKVPALRGKTIVNLFYEASTRTRTSFEIAGKWLSADVTHKYGILKQPFIDENLAYLERGEFVASKRLVTMACLHMWLDAHGTAH